MEKNVKLIKLASCSGCGAKVGAGFLQEMLSDIKVKEDKNLIVGYDKADDACVYKVDDNLAIVQTVDFFPPIADDPYTFGQIAATNALSDIYAMGATPKTALNVMAIPKDMSKEDVNEILKGGYDKVYEAGAVIAGGHSIYDDEPKYGLSVMGYVNPQKILTNSGAKDGDVLIYTKPLGIGIMTTAIKASMLSDEESDKVFKIMTTLNKKACEIMLKYDVHACTDVTGFSMLGHSLEMAQGSNVKITFDVDKIEIIDKTIDFAKLGIIPEGAYRNRKFVNGFVKANDTPVYMQDILFDPQTSGGLLIAVSSDDAEKLSRELKENNLCSNIIAKCEKYEKDEFLILNQNSNTE